MLELGTRNYLCGVSARDLAVCEEYSEEPDPPEMAVFDVSP